VFGVTATPLDLSRRLLEDPSPAGKLVAVDPCAIEGQAARVAFWLNVYNARLRAELAERPRSGSLLRQRGLFRRSAWRVGEHDYPLDAIEHGLLRRNARPPASLRRVLREGDPRLDAAPPELDPRIHFALNCGAQSCPLVRPYHEADVDAQLEAATKAYFAQEASVDRHAGRVELPGLCKLYSADFGSREEVLAFAGRQMDEDLGGLKVSFARFDWTLVGG